MKSCKKCGRILTDILMNGDTCWSCDYLYNRKEKNK